jgi:hypothetical protein
MSTIALATLLFSLVIWRVTRFWLKDSLPEEMRMKLEGWLSKRVEKLRYRKALELVTCAWCISVWVSAGLTGLWVWQEGGIGWFWTGILWLASAAGAMAAWSQWEDG